MKQETFIDYNGEKNTFRSLTVSEYTCPHCRVPVKFVIPDQEPMCNLKDTKQELAYYKQLSQSLLKDNYDLRMFCRRLASQ